MTDRQVYSNDVKKELTPPLERNTVRKHFLLKERRDENYITLGAE